MSSCHKRRVVQVGAAVALTAGACLFAFGPGLPAAAESESHLLRATSAHVSHGPQLAAAAFAEREAAVFSAKRPGKGKGLRGATFAAITSQDNPLAIRLSKNGKRVDRIAFHWDAKCTSGDTFTFGDIMAPTAKPPSGPVAEDPYLPLSNSGGFKGSALVIRDLGKGRLGTLSQEISGKLTASKGAGTWSAHFEAVDVASGQKVDTCDTGTIRWTAPKPQSLYFAGATSRNEPVVVQLNRTRRTVRVFRIGWRADCLAAGAPPGSAPVSSLATGDALADFPIRRGKFADKFSNTYRRPDGGTNKFDYEVSGRVGRKKASGSFRGLLTSLGSNGVTEGTCDSLKLKWAADVGPGSVKRKGRRR